MEGDPTLIGLAALIAAIGGIISTIVGVRKARRDERAKAEEECLQRLKEARKESEDLAAELHQLRMRHEGVNTEND
jgi:uncharacterized membrane protein